MKTDCARRGAPKGARGWSRPRRLWLAAYTLVEALVSMLILGIMVTGIVAGFMQSHSTSEWSSYSLAAQNLAIQPIEQARAARWEPMRPTPLDELVAANFPGSTNVLDVPVSGNNVVYATNRVTIRTIATDPPLREIYVECTWTFSNRGVFTNTMLTYRAPNQ